MTKKLKEWVLEALIESPTLRDSNEKLYYEYLKYLNYDVDNTPIKKFLQDMNQRRIPYLDSVGRASRLCQEKHAELRGNYWGKRKVIAVKVKHEMIANKVKN